MTASRRSILLKEWQPKTVELSPVELQELQECGAGLLIQPRAPGQYLVQPTSVVGAINTATLRTVIQPKFEIDRLFHLLGKARGLSYLRENAQLEEHPDITEGFVAMFASMVRSCLRRGLLMGYRSREESLHVIRGRVRVADQLRRRFALPLPAEVRYDDYTEDIEENRLVKAAIRRLIAFRPASPGLRRRLAEMQAALSLVSDVRYSANELPRFTYTRLNQHYRAVLELSGLLIQNLVVEFRPGARQVSAMLFDMNKVFEDFIFESLRQRLPMTGSTRDFWLQGERLQLDREALLRPEPDLSWWRGGRCLFVGDAKYKLTAEGRLSDLYQLFAYCTASGLEEGLLVYAEQTSGPARHQIVRGGPVLRVEAVNVEASIAAIEQRCDELADLVRQSADRARRTETSVKRGVRGVMMSGDLQRERLMPTAGG